MTFSADQIKELTAPLYSGHVKQRQQAGRNLSYIEAWWAIAEANRIFGFDAWNRTTVDLRQLGEPREVDGKWRVAYMARVRVTVATPPEAVSEIVQTEGRTIIREGCGYGSGIDKDLGQAHESALKEAESDAMKRALMTFGNPFGLALYDKTQANVVSGAAPPPSPVEQLAASSGRKSSRQAKLDKDDEKVKADVAKLDRDGIRDWHLNFDAYTASLPYSWLDSIHNMLELRLEELNGADSVAGEAGEMDAAFRNGVGAEVRSPVAGNNPERQGAPA